MTKKTYQIPVIWQMTGTYEIEAETLEEAEHLALNGTDFPSKQYYEDGSFFLDTSHPDYGEVKEEK